MIVDGVPLTVTLTDRAISAKLKGARKRQASVALFGLFQNLLREWRKDHPAPLPQEALPLEEDRP
jgi:hypothetical protein